MKNTLILISALIFLGISAAVGIVYAKEDAKPIVQNKTLTSEFEESETIGTVLKIVDVNRDKGIYCVRVKNDVAATSSEIFTNASNLWVGERVVVYVAQRSSMLSGTYPLILVRPLKS